MASSRATGNSAKPGAKRGRSSDPLARQKRANRTGARATPAETRSPQPSANVRGQDPAPSRAKLVRDSFTMPKPEYSVLAELKLRAARLGQPAKRSELLRAGVAALRSMPNPAFMAALAAVPTLKPGRPKGSTAAVEPAAV